MVSMDSHIGNFCENCDENDRVLIGIILGHIKTGPTHVSCVFIELLVYPCFRSWLVVVSAPIYHRSLFLH